jgi:hypothetical protein
MAARCHWGNYEVNVAPYSAPSGSACHEILAVMDTLTLIAGSPLRKS